MSDKDFTPLPYPLGGAKAQIFKFSNNSVSCQYILWQFHMQTEVQNSTINMKHIKHYFWAKACVSTPWVDLGVGVNTE